MFGKTNLLLNVCFRLIPRFHRSIVNMHDAIVFRLHGFPCSEEPSSSCKRLSSISCERDVFPFSTKTCSVSSSFPDQSQIGLGLDWVGLESLTRGASPKRLLNELSNWLLFNCRTRLIIPFGPVVIVFQ